MSTSFRVILRRHHISIKKVSEQFRRCKAKAVSIGSGQPSLPPGPNGSCNSQCTLPDSDPTVLAIVPVRHQHHCVRWIIFILTKLLQTKPTNLCVLCVRAALEFHRYGMRIMRIWELLNCCCGQTPSCRCKTNPQFLKNSVWFWLTGCLTDWPDERVPASQ